jgi:hypothetical protein
VTAPAAAGSRLNDTNVPPSESQQIYDALRGLGRNVELLVFDDDGHEIVKRENRTVLVRAMSGWLVAAFAASTHFVIIRSCRKVWTNCPPGKPLLRASSWRSTRMEAQHARWWNSRRHCARLVADRSGRRIPARLLQEL